MHVNQTKYFVDMSTTREVIFGITDGENVIQRNWKLITILLLVLASIVLTFTYCQPTFFRIRKIFERLTSHS